MTTNFPVQDDAVVAAIAALNAKTPTLGQQGAAGSTSVVLASNDPLVIATGAKNDAVASDDTGSFSLIALFKRLLQRVTTLIAVNDGTKGVTTSENLFGATATPQLLVAGSATRRRLIITNPSANTVRLGLSTGPSTPYASCPIILVPGESWVESTAAPLAWYGVLESGTANVPYQAVV